MPGGEETDDTEHGAALSKHLTFRIDPDLEQSLAVRAMAEGIGGRKNLSRLYRVLLRAGLAGAGTTGSTKP